MATTDSTPRFFKVFLSQYCSDSLLIPIAYYDQFPRLLSQTAILKGPGGRSWNVAIEMKQEELYFEQGWARFVEDNNLRDGYFLTFVYDGDRIFEVSIYDHNGDKDTRAVTEVEEAKEDSVCSLTSEDTDKGKSKVEVVEDSDAKEDSAYSLNSEDTETDTCSEFKVAKTIPKRRDTGKKKKKVVESSDEDSESSDEDSDSDYAEAFGSLDLEESSSSDDSYYAPDNEDTATRVKPKLATNLKKKAAAKKTKKAAAKKTKKVEPKIKNPETYLDDPKNIYFETNVKNRIYELLVHAQLVKDYRLRFGDYVDYIDPKGKFRAITAKWKDQRVCIKKWKLICKRNALKKEDRVLCELLRRRDFVYAIKLHIIRGRDMWKYE